MDTTLPLYRIDGTDRTVRVSHEFATRFGGMTPVEEAVSESPARQPRAKTAPKTNSSKEGK